MISKWPPENSWKHLLLFEQSYTNKKQQYVLHRPDHKTKGNTKKLPGPSASEFLYHIIIRRKGGALLARNECRPRDYLELI